MIDNYYEIKNIVQDLYDEFVEEEKKLNDICDSNSVRIDELDHKIANYKKNDDVDFKVFSPRNISGVNNDKIINLEKEKSELENEAANSSKQLKYYSDKVAKLDKILLLLNSKNHIKEDDVFKNVIDYEESDNESKSNDSFDDLFPLKNIDTNKDVESTVKNSDKKIESNKIINSGEEDGSILNTSDKNDLLENDYITPGSIAHIIHKAEFTERIIANDTIRAKLELKEVIRLLKDLIKK